MPVNQLQCSTCTSVHAAKTGSCLVHAYCFKVGKGLSSTAVGMETLAASSPVGDGLNNVLTWAWWFLGDSFSEASEVSPSSPVWKTHQQCQ